MKSPLGRLRRRKAAIEVPQDRRAPTDVLGEESASTLTETEAGGSSISELPEENGTYSEHEMPQTRKAPIESSSSTESMAAWIRSLNHHQKLYFYLAVFSILSFSATRNWNLLRILPFIAVAEILRNLLIWAIYLTDTQEAQLLRDFFIMLGGRAMTEVERTREGGFFRRRFEAIALGGANKFHGTAWNVASGYVDHIQDHAKERRAAATDDFLTALAQNPLRKNA